MRRFRPVSGAALALAFAPSAPIALGCDDEDYNRQVVLEHHFHLEAP